MMRRNEYIDVTDYDNKEIGVSFYNHVDMVLRRINQVSDGIVQSMVVRTYDGMYVVVVCENHTKAKFVYSCFEKCGFSNIGDMRTIGSVFIFLEPNMSALDMFLQKDAEVGLERLARWVNCELQDEYKGKRRLVINRDLTEGEDKLFNTLVLFLNDAVDILNMKLDALAREGYPFREGTPSILTALAVKREENRMCQIRCNVSCSTEECRNFVIYLLKNTDFSKVFNIEFSRETHDVRIVIRNYYSKIEKLEKFVYGGGEEYIESVGTAQRAVSDLLAMDFKNILGSKEYKDWEDGKNDE